MSIFGFGKSYKPDADMELLVTVYDFGSRAVVESLLRNAEIPYIIKDRGGSVPVITGSSVFGTDFFVRESDLDVAEQLIVPAVTENDENAENADDLSDLVDPEDAAEANASEEDGKEDEYDEYMKNEDKNG